MKFKSKLQKWLVFPVVGLILMLTGVLAPVASVHAEPTEQSTSETEVKQDDENTEKSKNKDTKDDKSQKGDKKDKKDKTDEKSDDNTEENKDDEDKTDDEKKDDEETENTCYDQVDGIGWLVCPTTGVFARAIDSIYGIIEDLLVVKPLTTDNSSPIYIVWQYARDITNIVFIIMLLVVVWSQLTGVGINNYGIKKTLPRLIIAAIMVNLSFIICTLAVDASNILGASLRGFFTNIQETAIASGGAEISAGISWGDLVAGLIGGGAVAGVAIGLSGGLGAFLWMLIGAVIAGLLAVFVGLVTIALRQAVVFGLVMVAPLAFVCYLLPNTEKWFTKWKDMLFSMLIFYPMFSALFGAAQLAGWALIASSGGNAFWTILGMAVQVVPLFLSVSLMKMSGTVLGTVSNKLSNLTNKPSAAARTWANSNRDQRRQRHVANSMMPSASLRRYLDGRRRLREIDTENSMKNRAAEAEKYAQGVLRGNRRYYALGGTERDKNGNLINADAKGFRTNRYTRNAARTNALGMEAANATADTSHVLSNYGTYHGRSVIDRQIAGRTAEAYKNTFRTTATAFNDNIGDVDFLVNSYLDIAQAKGHKKGTDPHDTAEYRHFITAAGGNRGEVGEASVLAQVIEQAAKNESTSRKQLSILQAKFKYNKAEARSMLVGYKVNDDGLAIDENGKAMENRPGYLLRTNPKQLIPYDIHDERGRAYYNMTDQNGNVITRVYKNDGPMIKEVLSNFDMPINDPINGLYGILSGIDEGSIEGLPDVGLSRFSTTIGRAMLSSGFKQKAAFAGPMYATSVMNRYIKDDVHQDLARLDNLLKTAKAVSFNVQDFAELSILDGLMDPANWEKRFPLESLRSYRNVNGEPLKPFHFEKDENGKDQKKFVSPEKATQEEFFNAIRDKWLVKLAPKMASMMSRYTQATADNQKPGTDEAWEKLYRALQNYNNPELKDKYDLPDPFAEQQGFYTVSRDIRNKIHPRNQKIEDRGAYDTNNPASSSTILRNSLDNGDLDNVPNIHYQLEHLRDDNSYDADAFAEAVLSYLEENSGLDPRFNRAYDAVAAYVHSTPFSSVDELYEEFDSIFVSIFAE